MKSHVYTRPPKRDFFSTILKNGRRHRERRIEKVLSPEGGPVVVAENALRVTTTTHWHPRRPLKGPRVLWVSYQW
jgi:hypothetical protein